MQKIQHVGNADDDECSSEREVEMTDLPFEVRAKGAK